MRTVQCCLWRGHETCYGPDYVELLRRGVERHVPDGRLQVLVDEYHEAAIRKLDVDVVPFKGFGCGGWSNVLEAFHPDLAPAEGERNLLVGLDTVFTGDCEWLFEWDKAPVGIPLDPLCPPEACDAVITYDREGAALVWAEFERTRGTGMKEHFFAGAPSEMALLRNLRAALGWEVLEAEPRLLRSYKVHGYDPCASIVYFHGKPRPGDLPEGDPVRALWLE